MPLLPRLLRAGPAGHRAARLLAEAPAPETERTARFYGMTTGTRAAGSRTEQAVALIRRDMLARWTQTLLARGQP